MKNKIIHGEGFFISYAEAGSGPTGTETALVKDNEYFILNGDWREKYKPLISKGYDVCKELFEANKDKHINFWSD